MNGEGIISVVSALVAVATAIISWYYHRKSVNILLKQFEKPRIIEIIRGIISPLIKAIEEYLVRESFLLSSYLCPLLSEADVEEISALVQPSEKWSDPRIVAEEFKIILEKEGVWGKFEECLKDFNKNIDGWNKAQEKIVSKLEEKFKNDEEVPENFGDFTKQDLAKEFLTQYYYKSKNYEFSGAWFILSKCIGKEKGVVKFKEAEESVKRDRAPR